MTGITSNLTVREVEARLAGDPDQDFLAACRLDPRAGVRRAYERRMRRSAAQDAETARMESLLAYERKLWRQGFLLVAGVDEAGRGPLAGPVLAGACVLPSTFDLPGLNDSKQIPPQQREQLYARIVEQALAWAVGSADVTEIDELNILEATKLAMQRALAGLQVRPHHVLTDAVKLPALDIPQTPLINGDSLSASIAAASILAKVSRDRLMHVYASTYPGYGFEQHKGYPTPEHMAALKRLGPCPLHRLSFAPVRTAVAAGRG